VKPSEVSGGDVVNEKMSLSGDPEKVSNTGQIAADVCADLNPCACVSQDEKQAAVNATDAEGT
jgi:hypothetical protein